MSYIVLEHDISNYKMYECETKEEAINRIESILSQEYKSKNDVICIEGKLIDFDYSKEVKININD